MMQKLLKLVKEKRLELIFLMIFGFFILVPLSKATQGYALAGNDPWFHLYLTEHGEKVQFFGDRVQLSDSTTQLTYPTFMRSMIYVLDGVTGVDMYQMYFYGGFFARAILLGVIYIYIKKFMLKDQKYMILLLPVIAFSSMYFMRRIWITFPENFAVIFHAATLVLASEIIRDNKNKLLWLVGLCVSASLYYHSPSLVVVGVILAAFFGAYLFKHRSKTAVVNLTLTSAGIALFSAPMLTPLIGVVKGLITSNITETNFIVEKVEDNASKFSKPDLLTYIRFTSYLLVFFGLVGVFEYFKTKLKDEKFILAAYVIFTFVLSLGSLIGVYVPTIRMQGYLVVPLIIIAFLGVSAVFNKLQANKLLYIGALTVTFMIAIVNLTSLGVPYLGRIRGSALLDVGKYLNEHYEPGALYYFGTGRDPMYARFSHPEAITIDREKAKFEVTREFLSDPTRKLILSVFVFNIYEKNDASTL